MKIGEVREFRIFKQFLCSPSAGCVYTQLDDYLAQMGATYGGTAIQSSGNNPSISPVCGKVNLTPNNSDCRGSLLIEGFSVYEERHH